MASIIKVDKIAQASGTPEFTIPTADGAANTFLKTDGSGVLSFGSVTTTALTGSTNTWIPTITAANALTGTANFTYDGSILDVKNSGTASSIKLYCESSNAHAQEIKAAPHAGSSAWTLTLPGTAPSVSGQALTATTAGVASWATVGGTNTPYFYAYLSADQSPANNTWTKVTCDTVAFQTGSTYDNSTNYRWTPGVAGKYFIAGQCEARTGTIHSLVQMDISIYKNGSQFISGVPVIGATGQVTMQMGHISGIIDMNTTDYVEFWSSIDSGASARSWDDGYQTTHFMGYKLLD